MIRKIYYMKIAVLLPYKENYSKKSAGAVSIFVNDTNNLSKFKKETKKKFSN